MHSPIRLSRTRARRYGLALPVVLGAVALVASACGGSSTPAAASNSDSPPSTTAPLPGASGQIAALTPPSMEVQSESAQTTVSWTSSTTFTQTVTGSLSTVAAGDCVTVTGTPSSPGSSDSPITARSVSILQPSSSGSCTRPTANTGGGSFAGFPRRSGSSSTTFPHGTFPSGSAPSFTTAFGKVTSASSSGLVVSGTELSGFDFRRSGSSTTTTTTPPTTDITVSTTSSTTVEETESATASALSVGECVTALGPADSTGAVTANSISIRQAVNGSCFGGFGGGGFGGGGFGGGGFGGGGGSGDSGASNT